MYDYLEFETLTKVCFKTQFETPSGKPNGRWKAYLGLFVVFHELLRRHPVQVTQLGLDHDGNVPEHLLDDPFWNAIHRPAHVSLEACKVAGKKKIRRPRINPFV